ncbi:DUF659 domain-containing protein [Mycena venus]|uniref:DUF659 domain-containing protein n=1 Tax=Mycena venus TaxID=2733690 RepID=A0A8H6X3A4_9AGAR|nr:DUF659 domain-containing protein [Mycena venus]
MSTATETSRAGRKAASFISNHFERLNKKAGKSNRYLWKCNYCGDDHDSLGASLEGRDNVLPNHIADSRTCSKAPPHARNEALRYMADKKKTSETNVATNSRDDDNSVIDVDALVATEASRKKRKAAQGTLNGYIDQAMTETQKNSADRKFLRFLIHANVAFQTAENPYLEDFLHDLRPTYDAPNRYPLSKTLLDAEASDVFLREAERLQNSKLLTLLEDGWEDKLKRSIYGVVAAAIDSFPIIMSLDDLTGERGNAAKCLDIAIKSLELMGVPDGRNFIALTTDNPTTMQAFRREFQRKFFWVLTFACFLHSLNTLVGDICSYPLIKKIISKANRTVTFFNSSHYWGGQLKEEAARLKITRGLKKNCESRWYALILLCVSVGSHRQPLQITCLREDAQNKRNGLSAVSPDVLANVLQTPEFWPLLAQLVRITKPIVDAIGNCESRQATLADCMLELIRCARAMSTMKAEENEDTGFLAHAKQTFDRRFKMIATPIHWLALFLHPLCRKLAVSKTTHGRSLDFMIETALGLAKQWKWSAPRAHQLKTDLKAYFECKSPFTGGRRNAREWWAEVPRENHEAIRDLAIALASIVPHSADVERLFSDLGGIQTPRRSCMTVPNMEKIGKIRSRLSYELYVTAKAKTGNTVHRKHNHMHTQSTPGVNADLAKDLENPITWIPPLDSDNMAEEDIVEKAFEDLQKAIEDEAPAPVVPGSITNGELVDWKELERVESGVPLVPAQDSIEIVGDDTPGGWSIEDVMSM